MGGFRYLTAIVVIIIFLLSGCSLFVAQQPSGEEQVCVPKAKLTELLSELNVSIEELTGENASTGNQTPAEEMPEESIAQLVSTDADLSDLKSALDAANLTSTLSGQGTYTLFAPTNEAFDKLPTGLLDALMKNPSTLSDILLYHVASGRITASDLAKKTSLTTLEGKDLSISYSGGVLKINDAGIVTTDIMAANGVIHVIDTVLIPPASSEETTPAQNETGQVPSGGEQQQTPAANESGIPTKYYTEGDLVKLTPNATDADGDALTFTYSAPLDSNGEWQTGPGDAGTYLVTVTASDGTSTVSKQVRIVVRSGNSPPVIEGVGNMTVQEGDTVKFSPTVTDPDGDDVTISYSGWMTSSSYTTNYNDAGVHDVTITASDGKSQTVKTVQVTVLNKDRPPVLSPLSSVTVDEGDTVVINAQASDPDGDNVTITYSPPIGSDGTWQTHVGDAGTYLVTVTASDGQLETKQTMTVIVQSTNSPPVIQMDNVNEVVQEGSTKTITLNPVVTDPDGDDVTVSYSGWMTSATKVISEADAGTHDVTITASDGQAQTTKTITVTVKVNHPPSFTI